MKRYLPIIICVAALLAACVKETPKEEIAEANGPVFYITAEESQAPDTKVYVDENLAVRFEHDDRFSVFNKKQHNEEYKFDGPDGAKKGPCSPVKTDSGVYAQIPYVYAVYPYMANTMIDSYGTIETKIPEVQYYRENSFGRMSNLMVSVGESTDLELKNACGYLALQLYGDDVNVSEITLTGNGGQALSGLARITMQPGGAPSIAFQKPFHNSIRLECPNPVKIGSTPETATIFWIVVPPTYFKNGFTVEVTDVYMRTFTKATYKEFTISRNKRKLMKPVEVVLPDFSEPVDLGLSVKWAAVNLGATKPEQYGDYYAWGETEPYYSSLDPLTWKPNMGSGYSWTSYKFTPYNNDQYIIKYNFDIKRGYVDNLSVLEPEDDAAHVVLGGDWRMPTKAELDELLANCSWQPITVNGINGFRVFGTDDKTCIFLPAGAGWEGTSYSEALGTMGRYWSSTIWSIPEIGITEHSSDLAYYMPISYSASTPYNTGGFDRYFGLSIRPVYESSAVASVSLNKSALTLQVGKSETLTATVLPAIAANKNVTWQSSNTGVATVDANGTVTAVAIGTATITVTTEEGGKQATCAVTVTAPTGPDGQENGHSYVDLGLPSGVMWALGNIGELDGDYFAWGETSPHYEPGYANMVNAVWKTGYSLGYSWYNYSLADGDYNKLNKYNNISSYGKNGFTDGKTVLEAADDPATTNWGGGWRTPTWDEFMELVENCTSVWINAEDGTCGRRFTSKINGKSIFLPACGARAETGLSEFHITGEYWSANIHADGIPWYGMIFIFNSSSVHTDSSTCTHARNVGCLIRPVINK